MHGLCPDSHGNPLLRYRLFKYGYRSFHNVPLPDQGVQDNRRNLYRVQQYFRNLYADGCTRILTARAIGSHAVKLAWNEVFPGQDSVAILVQIWNGEWVQLANVDGATSEYTDISGVSPLATYTYQVRAFRGNSFADSNLASVTIPGYVPADSAICVAGPLPNQPQITSTPVTVAREGVLYSYN